MQYVHTLIGKNNEFDFQWIFVDRVKWRPYFIIEMSTIYDFHSTPGLGICSFQKNTTFLRSFQNNATFSCSFAFFIKRMLHSFTFFIKKTQRSFTFFIKNAAFFAFFYVFYKRMRHSLRSLRSFTFFIKERGVLLHSFYVLYKKNA